uniref:Serpin domain-containing protein n=1 Tax=Myotis myotis TaxID=51298 RepID=A0A7J7T6L9_MYOMY|nr:hypothetical protein mMyoMyo1_009237 [Myotis myotis]
MALLRGLLVLSLSCLQGPCSVFSPASAMEPLSQQIVIGPSQEKLSPLSFLKLVNQEPDGKTDPKAASGDCNEAPAPEQTRRLAKAMMAFTTDLFSQVAQSSTHPNLVLSPLSVALALSHLALGAQNRTLQRLQKVLHADSGPCLPHLLSVNRPFLFFILEDTTSLPLFVGSVRNPNPGAQREHKEQQDSPDSRDLFQDLKDFVPGDKPFDPDLKLEPLFEEDYPQFSTPK